MSVIDFRRGKLIEVSQDQEDELLCVQVVKGGRKVVVGSQLGVLLLWTWGQWLDTTDRYPGHPESIECMVAIDDDTVITGSADGVIRIVNILPNRMIGVVGEHDDDMSVQRMAITHDKGYLGSCSDDNKIKFWNIGFLFEEDGEDDEEEEQQDEEEAQDLVGNADAEEGSDDEEADEDENVDEEEDSVSSDEPSNSDEDSEGDEEDDEEEGMKSKVRERGRSSRIPSKRKRNSPRSESPDDSADDQGPQHTTGDESEEDSDEEDDGEESRVKPDAKQKLSTLLTSLPVGQKLSLQERRQLIKKQRQLKKTIKQEKKEKREMANAARQSQVPQKEKAQNNKKRKVGEHNEMSSFFSDL